MGIDCTAYVCLTPPVQETNAVRAYPEIRFSFGRDYELFFDRIVKLKPIESLMKTPTMPFTVCEHDLTDERSHCATAVELRNADWGDTAHNAFFGKIVAALPDDAVVLFQLT